MEMPTVSEYHNLGACSRGLEEISNDEKIRGIQSRLENLKKLRDTVEISINLPASQKKKVFPVLYPDLYSSQWDRARAGTSRNISVYGVALAPFGAVAACTLAIQLGLGGAAISISALAGLLGPYMVGPPLYHRVMNDWIIPRRVERSMNKSLAESLEKMNDKIRTTESYIDSRRSQLLKDVLENEASAPSINIIEEDDFVSIDGMKLAKNFHLLQLA